VQAGCDLVPEAAIWCYNGSTPQSSRDKVRVKGLYEEFFDVSEINIPAGAFDHPRGCGARATAGALDVNTIHTASPTAEDWKGSSSSRFGTGHRNQAEASAVHG